MSERYAQDPFIDGLIRGYLIGNIVGWPLVVTMLAIAWFR